MDKPDWRGPLAEAFARATAYLEGLPDRPVRGASGVAELRAAMDGPLPEAPTDPREVVAALADAAEPGAVAVSSGRFFGFVIGGATPAALAADWLTSTWDQNAGLYACGPPASVAEEVAARWLTELLRLPRSASVGFVTGAQMANATAFAAARHEVLRRRGWDVETDGLCGAPRIRVLAGANRHSTIDRALRFLGIGTSSLVPIDAGDDGRMSVDGLRSALGAGSGPTIVSAQVGEVNTGGIDPVGQICDLAHEHGAWVHVDGAFGLWAAASPTYAPLVAGVERADSWATDAHKWLNVPYDSGLVFCAHPEVHRAAMGIRASYLMHGAAGERDALEYNPEFSRRARGFAVYAAIRALGRTGVAAIVDRCCAMARRFGTKLAAADSVDVLNDVVLNQVLVRFRSPTGDADADDVHTQQVVAHVQDDGTCWMSGTTWRGRPAMRISVCNWSTDEDDVDRSVAAILRAAEMSRSRVHGDDAPA